MRISSLRIPVLATLLVILAIIGWALAWFTAERGLPAPVLGLTAMITLLADMVLLLVLGIRVLRDRSKPVADRLNPIAAARTLVLAQASAYVGAMVGGMHIGVLMHRVPMTGLETGSTAEALAMAITGVATLVVGMIVERWCKVPPDDPEDAEKRRRETESGPEPDTA